MARWTLTKSKWDGNQWPSVEVDKYEYADFLKILTSLSAAFAVPLPPIVDVLDGYSADLLVEGVRARMLLDNWTFSVAAESAELRDRIWSVMQGMD